MTVALGTSLSFAELPAVLALLVGLVVFVAIGALSHEHERPFSSAMIYLAVGLGAAVLIHLLDLSWPGMLTDPHVLQRVAELTLVFALFATGLRMRPFTRTQMVTVALLVGVVMTVTVAAVAAYGTLLMGLSLGAAIILGGIVAPTDPVLAGGLGAHPPLESEEEPDGPVSLSGESGLNDGAAGPFVLLGVFVASSTGTGWLDQWLLYDVLYGIGVAALVGVLGGYGVSALAVWLRDRGLVAEELDGWVAVGAALAIFGAAQALGSYGFIAVFVGGIAFRRSERGAEYSRRVHDSADVVRNFAELGTILLFASMVDVAAVTRPGVAGWLLVVVLLLVIRPLAVLATLAPVRIRPRERVFIAWFGVKGVASLYYVGAVLATGVLTRGEAGTITWTVAATVLVSIVVHGVTASRLRTRLVAPA